LTKTRDTIDALAAYWTSLAGGKVPARDLLDPAAILPLLPWLLLCDFEENPFRVRYRLTGTLVDQWNRSNITGRYLDELDDEGYHGAVDKLQVSYRACFERAAPIIDDYDWPGPHGGVLKVRFGLFPLLLDGTVRQCLAIEDYSALPHRYDGGPLTR